MFGTCLPIVGFAFWLENNVEFFGKNEKKEEEEEEHSIKSSLYLQENQLRDDGGESSLGLTRINDDIMPNREKLFRFKIVSNFHFKFKPKTNSFNPLLPHEYDDNKRLKWILCCIDLFLGCIVGCLAVFIELFRNPNT